MTIHAMIIGRRAETAKMPNDDEINAIAALVSLEGYPKSPTFFVDRCDSPGVLVQTLRRIAVDHGQIDTLDLFDHGGAGKLRMGNDLLFNGESNGGFSIAEELRDLIVHGGRMRLLGCNTALGVKGRNLLVRLHNIFDGHVTVFGTIAGTTIGQFDRHGFRKKYIEEFYLYSSEDAIRDWKANRRPPKFSERDKALIAWGQRQRDFLPQSIHNESQS